MPETGEEAWEGYAVVLLSAIPDSPWMAVGPFPTKAHAQLWLTEQEEPWGARARVVGYRSPAFDLDLGNPKATEGERG